jgi:hypothetical protein
VDKPVDKRGNAILDARESAFLTQLHKKRADLLNILKIINYCMAFLRQGGNFCLFARESGDSHGLCEQIRALVEKKSVFSGR